MQRLRILTAEVDAMRKRYVLLALVLLLALLAGCMHTDVEAP